MLLNHQYNQTFTYAIIISIIVHIAIGVILYTLIIRKNNDVNIHHYIQSSDTVAVPINTITPKIVKKQHNQNSVPVQQRIKVIDAATTHSSQENTITPKIVKKQHNQNSVPVQQRIKVIDAATTHSSQENTITPKIVKKQQNVKTNIHRKNHTTCNHASHHDHDQLKYLINTLTQEKSYMQNDKQSQFNEKNIYNNKNNNIHVTNHEIDTYKNMIRDAIRCKFYNVSSYIGKQCNLHMKLNADGKLLFITAVSGDPVLCQAAIIAAKSANFPKPPNIHIYKIFKNITLNFTPQ